MQTLFTNTYCPEELNKYPWTLTTHANINHLKIPGGKKTTCYVPLNVLQHSQASCNVVMFIPL